MLQVLPFLALALPAVDAARSSGHKHAAGHARAAGKQRLQEKEVQNVKRADGGSSVRLTCASSPPLAPSNRSRAPFDRESGLRPRLKGLPADFGPGSLPSQTTTPLSDWEPAASSVRGSYFVHVPGCLQD